MRYVNVGEILPLRFEIFVNFTAEKFLLIFRVFGKVEDYDFYLKVIIYYR